MLKVWLLYNLKILLYANISRALQNINLFLLTTHDVSQSDVGFIIGVSFITPALVKYRFVACRVMGTNCAPLVADLFYSVMKEIK